MTVIDALALADEPSTATAPRWSAGVSAEATQAGARLWFSKGQADIGLGFETLYDPLRIGHSPRLDPWAPASATPALMLGLRYRPSSRLALFADASATRFASVDRSDYSFNKVGVEWKSTQSRLSFLRGGLNYRMDNGSRMTIKFRSGVVGLYLRSEF